MKLQKLHIVSLDIPFPPNYGGVIDIFYKAKALKKAGIHITLHCYEYGRGRNHDFTTIADEVFYYDRPTSMLQNLSLTPFIVKSRVNKELVQNLLKDNGPILMEGTHCSFLLDEPLLKKRVKLVRIHNIEHDYYKALADASSSLFKKLFFYIESYKLKRYDKTLNKASALFCLSDNDLNHYSKINSNSFLLPIAFDFETNIHLNNTKQFALYHGNLSVAENEKAVKWIVNTWQNQGINLPLKIAGKSPSNGFKLYLSQYNFIELIENPDDIKMKGLLQLAHIHLLITFQNTGVKLKLINALINGNHCIANTPMIENTDLESFCVISNSEIELANEIEKLKDIPQAANLENRISYLNNYYNPDKNIITFINQIENLLSCQEK